MKRLFGVLFLVVGLSTMRVDAALLVSYSFNSTDAGSVLDNDVIARDVTFTGMGRQDTAQTHNVGTAATAGGYYETLSAFNGTNSGSGINNQDWNSYSLSAYVGAKSGSQVTIDNLKFDAIAFARTGSGSSRTATTTDRAAFILSYRLRTLNPNGTLAPSTGAFTVLTPYSVNPPSSGVNSSGVITDESATGFVGNRAIRMVNAPHSIEQPQTFSVWALGASQMRTYTGAFRTPVTVSNGQVAEFRISFLRQGTPLGTTTPTAAQLNQRPYVRLDKLEFYGSAVPEPTSMAIFGAMGLGLAARRFRKK